MPNMTAEIPVSPTKSYKSASSTRLVPLDAPLRQVAIHPDLPQLKVPSTDLKPHQYHPVSCEPFSAEDLQHYKLPQLQKQYTTTEAALKAQAEAIQEVKSRMAEAEKRTREINHEMVEKEKERELERKIYMKQGKNLPEAV
jgi:hypothetical protein